MGLPKVLTEQQQKFAMLLVTNEGRMTPTECAVEAGYAEGSAHVRASELRNPRKFPLVVKHIDELRAELQEKYKVDYASHIAELAKLRNEAREKGAWSAAINAEVARGKAAGLYIEQKIIKHGKLEDLSERELEARLSQIIDDNKLLLEHEDVDSLKDKVTNPKEMRIVNAQSSEFEQFQEEEIEGTEQTETNQ